MNRRGFFSALALLPAALKAIALAPPPLPLPWWQTYKTGLDDPYPTTSNQIESLFETMWDDAQNPRPSTVFMSQETHRHLIERGLL